VQTQRLRLKNKAFVALGSNLQNPVLQVKQAFLALDKLPKTTVVNTSSLYLTAPIGYVGQPDFVNAVAEIQTELSPIDLLDGLLQIEQAAGRERSFANAPRVLDCDLLLYKDLSMQNNRLILPHPRMHERAFVLLPLAEIAPNLILKNHGSVVKLAQQYKNQGIQKIA
jgi:2-amino-4-hydroxy-6-hydroxymethyldihydropteridine diphosphokinase